MINPILNQLPRAVEPICKAIDQIQQRKHSSQLALQNQTAEGSLALLEALAQPLREDGTEFQKSCQATLEYARVRSNQATSPEERARLDALAESVHEQSRAQQARSEDRKDRALEVLGAIAIAAAAGAGVGITCHLLRSRRSFLFYR